MEGLITVVSFGDFLRFVVNKREEKKWQCHSLVIKLRSLAMAFLLQVF